MRVAFLVQDLGLSGGMNVIVDHARHLRGDHGADAQLVLTRDPAQAAGARPGLDELPVRTLEDARSESWDVVVATWWETTLSLSELETKRTAYFVQSLENRFYGEGDPRRSLAALTHHLPVPVITEAHWIAETLDQLRPPRTAVVPNGIDKGVFSIPDEAPTRRPGAPLRILVEGDPAAPFKGVPEALQAAAAMSEPRHVTLVTTNRAAAGELPADEVAGPLTPAQMAELMGASDVLLKLSRVEGMAMPPLETFHRGGTCVLTPVTGHDEYAVHGENALLVGFDDIPGTTRALDLLARDDELLARLRRGALATARAWPSTQTSAELMHEALRHVLDTPDSDPTRSAGRIMAAARGRHEAWGQLSRDHERLRIRMDRVEGIYQQVAGRIPIPTLRRRFERLRQR